MITLLIELLRNTVGLAAGGVIGFAFGMLQQAALRQNEERERAGRLKNAWTLMPGAGVRVAYLLITLALIQFVCPLLFAEGTQWVVSAGLLIGYGSMLFAQLRRRIKSGAR